MIITEPFLGSGPAGADVLWNHAGQIFVSHILCYISLSPPFQGPFEASQGLSEASQGLSEASQGLSKASQGLLEASQGLSEISQRLPDAS